MTKEDVLPWIGKHFIDGDYFFLQDSKLTKKGLNNLDMRIYPLHYSDISPLENYWEHLGDKVYAKGAYNFKVFRRDLEKEKSELSK